MSAKATTLKVSKHTDLSGTSTGYKVFVVIVLILVAIFIAILSALQFKLAKEK